MTPAVNPLASAIYVRSLCHWHADSFAGKLDALILQAAHQERLTLLTYDLETIPRLLAEWRISGTAHSGVILVDNRTVPSNYFGGLVRSLIGFWDEWGQEDLRNRAFI